MPRTVTRPFPPVGLANPGGPPDAGGLLDMDRAVVGMVGEYKPVGGWTRAGERLVETTMLGDAADELLIVRFDENYTLRHFGHGLAVVDNAINTRGRVLAISHHDSGLKGTKLAGNPRQITGSGLSDLSVRADFGGTLSRRAVVTITGTGSPNQFSLALDGVVVATGVSCSTSWAQVGSTGIYVKWGATTGHTSGNQWAFGTGGRVAYARAMKRLHAHHYPMIAAAEGYSLISHGFDAVYADDGFGVRQAGILRPQIPPTVVSEVVEPLPELQFSFNTTDDFGTSDGQWQRAASYLTFGRKTSDPAPPEGDSYASIQIPQVNMGGGIDLAYVNLASPVTIPANATVVKMRFYLNEREWVRSPVTNGPLALVFAASDALADERVVVNFEGEFRGKRWYDAEAPWTRQTAFAISSVGIRLDRSVPDLEYEDEDIDIFVDDIRIDSGEADAVVGSDLFAEGSGDWLTCFTFYDRNRRLESAPSPASRPFTGNGGAMRIDVSGWFPGIQAGLQNAVSDRGVDAVRLYLTNKNWEADPQTGGYQWRMVSPIDGILIADLETAATVTVEAYAGNTGDGEIFEAYAKPGCGDSEWTITVTSTSPAQFSVAMTGGNGGGDVTPTSLNAVGSPYVNGCIAFRLEQGATPFDVGDFFTLAVVNGTAANGRLVATIQTPTDEALLLAAPLAPWFNDRIPNGEIAAPIGRRVLIAGRPGVEFDATVADESSLVTGIDAALLGPWMEKRLFQVDGEDRVYVILKVLDTNADGVLDALWIVSQFNLDRATLREGESGGGYDGTGGTKRCRIVKEDDRFHWTNVTARGERAVDVQTSSPLNSFDFPGESFSIAGIAIVGQFAWVIDGNGKGAYVFLHNQNARDDVEPGQAFSQPIFRPGISCASKRACVRLPNGRGVVLGKRGEIFVLGESQYERHPLSEALTGLVAGRGLVLSAIGLRHAWGTAIDANRVVFGFRASPDYAGVNPNGEPGVVALAPSPRTYRSELLPYNWGPTDADLDDGFDELEAWEADARIWGQMHLIPGLCGWNWWNGESETSLWGTTATDDSSIAPHEPKAQLWSNGSADAAFFPKADYVEVAHAMFTIGDVSGLTAPGVNGEYSGATTNRSLPTTPPTPYTDCESHWDDRDGTLVKVSAIGARLAAVVPSFADLTNYNGANVIHGWGSFGPAGSGSPHTGDSDGEIFSHPCMVHYGIRLHTKEQWTTAPATPRPLAMVAMDHAPSGPLGPRDNTRRRFLDCSAVALRFRVWAEAKDITGTIAAGTFRLRFRDLATLAEEGIQPDEHPSDRVFTIAQALTLNAYTDVELIDFPARNGRYRDRDGKMRDCIYYTHIVLEQVLGIPEDRFNVANDDIHLFFAQGHQKIAAGTGTTLPPVNCDDQGSTDADEVDGEFEFGVVVDLERNALTPLSNFPITAVDPGHAATCVSDGRLPGSIIGGDAHGYVARLFEERGTGWGRPATLTKLRAGIVVPDDDPVPTGDGYVEVLRIRNAAAQRQYSFVVNDPATSWDLTWSGAGSQPNQAFDTVVAATPLVARMVDGTGFAVGDNFTVDVEDNVPFRLTENGLWGINLAGSGARTFYVDDAGPPLPTDPEDNAMLRGLIALRTWADADGEYRQWESRRILSNDDRGLAIDGAWVRALAGGDKLLVAPVVWMIHTAEIETAHHAALRSLRFNLDDQSHPEAGDGTAPILFRLEVFEGAGRAIRANNRAAVATRYFNANDLLSRREIFVPRHASKARSYRLTAVGRDVGTASVRNIVFTEVVHAAETGK